MNKTYQICGERDLRVVVYDRHALYGHYDVQLEMNGFGVVADTRMSAATMNEAIATFLYIIAAQLPGGIKAQHISMRMRYSMDQWVANHIDTLPPDFLTGLYRNWYVT